jgi:hypothetical protein
MFFVLLGALETNTAMRLADSPVRLCSASNAINLAMTLSLSFTPFAGQANPRPASARFTPSSAGFW